MFMGIVAEELGVELSVHELRACGSVGAGGELVAAAQRAEGAA